MAVVLVSGPVVVELREQDRVAVVVVTSPPLNLFDVDVRDGLIEALSFVRDVPEIRVLVLRSGLHHSGAGADLSEFGSADTVFDARRIRWERDPWSLLWELPIPTIASLRGIALGSAYEMALLCDLRVAAPDARLGLPETTLGMLPAAGGTQSLTAAIGPHAALPPVLLAATWSGADAADAGVVHRLDVDPDRAALAVAAEIAAHDPSRIRAAVRLCRHVTAPIPGPPLDRRLARGLRRPDHDIEVSVP